MKTKIKVITQCESCGAEFKIVTIREGKHKVTCPDCKTKKQIIVKGRL